MDWHEIVKEQISSGLSGREFCRVGGYSEREFYKHKRLLRVGRQELAPKFVRVESSNRVSLELEGGTKIRVLASDLKEVLAALR